MDANVFNNTKVESQILLSPLKNAWEHVGIKSHHGLNIPLFSIHSKKSCGIGEFLDLKLLIDFCEKISMDVIQLLPLNDSGYETSPYNAVSSIALNPIYLSLHALPFLANDEELQKELVGFEKYTFLQKVAYNAVLTAKLEFLRKYYLKYFSEVCKTTPYEEFVTGNPWVQDYGIFKMLKESYAHKGWFSWDSSDQNLSSSRRRHLLDTKSSEINFYIFLQYLCFVQLKEIKEYATSKKIYLKGDIPILISPESLDVWKEKENFDLNYSAGSLPDAFTPDGQNWGFPIYNWSYIEKSDYAFWVNRLKTASNFYHLYRIDHIIGLYRIFAIPRGKTPLDGSYIPDDPSLALVQGERILKRLCECTNTFPTMLPIGEDLGLDIQYIKESMEHLSIPGTIIPRWEKTTPTSHVFQEYSKYKPISLTSVSTHDSETLGQWWENNPEEALEFAKAVHMPYEPKLSYSLRFQILKDSHHTPSLFHINLLNEYLALFNNLIWDNPNDERINLPGTVLPSNWCYKTRPSLETLLTHNNLQHAIKDMVA